MRSIHLVCEQSDTVLIGTKVTHTSPPSQMFNIVEEILCRGRERNRSILCVCEDFAIRTSGAKFTHKIKH